MASATSAAEDESETWIVVTSAAGKPVVVPSKLTIDILGPSLSPRSSPPAKRRRNS